jgi:5-methylcytosine-specific restriction endonuclease McrA
MLSSSFKQEEFMVDIQKLSDEVLVENLKRCVRVDIDNGADLVSFISEVDRRRLFLKFGRANLFLFLTKNMGMANASAQLRIDAARVMHSVPEIAEDLRSGAVCLTQLSVLAQAFRQKIKEVPDIEITSEQKRDLVKKIRFTDAPLSQQIIAEELDLEIKRREIKRVQKDGSVRSKITFTKEQMSWIDRAEELSDHVNPNPTLAELFAFLAERFVRQKDPTIERRSKKTTKVADSRRASTSGPEVNSAPCNSTSAPEVTSAETAPPFQTGTRTHIPIGTRRLLNQRDRCCRWIDRNTGERCDSTFQLQIDHIVPLWVGGTNELSNLQRLCAFHNREKYKWEAGIRRV